MDDNEFLKHYGVLGMHWGRRKGKTESPEYHPASPHRVASEDHTKMVNTKGKKVHELTNAEIKAFNERMALEKQYKELTKAQMSPGMKFVNELLVSTGKDIAKMVVKRYATKSVEDLLKMSLAEAKAEAK